MKFLKATSKWWLCCVLSGAAASQVCAEVPTAFGYINNALGSADRQGYCAVWCHFDQRIQVSKELELPIRFQFNSNPRFAAEPCLGSGWWFPILESTVVKQDEGTILMHSPGGFVHYFHRDPEIAGRYLTRDWKYEGQQISDTGFEVRGKDGWKFRFNGGRLTDAESPQGERLTWKYEGDRVDSIQSQKGGELLKAAYDPVSGNLASLSFNRGKDEMRFDYGMAPLITSLLERNVVSRTVATLARVRNNHGFDGRFEIAPSNELDQLSLGIDYTSEDGKKFGGSFAWDPLSKLLKRDGLGPYAIELPKDGNAKTFISRTMADGKVESYKYDANSAVLETVTPKGEIFTRRYVGTPGLAYGKLTSETLRLPSGDEWVRQRYYYDQKGDIVRMLFAATPSRLIEKRYDANGELAAYMEHGAQVMFERKDDGNVIVKRNGSSGTGAASVFRDGRLVVPGTR